MGSLFDELDEAQQALRRESAERRRLERHAAHLEGRCADSEERCAQLQGKLAKEVERHRATKLELDIAGASLRIAEGRHKEKTLDASRVAADISERDALLSETAGLVDSVMQELRSLQDAFVRQTRKHRELLDQLRHEWFGATFELQKAAQAAGDLSGEVERMSKLHRSACAAKGAVDKKLEATTKELRTNQDQVRRLTAVVRQKDQKALETQICRQEGRARNVSRLCDHNIAKWMAAAVGESLAVQKVDAKGARQQHVLVISDADMRLSWLPQEESPPQLPSEAGAGEVRKSFKFLHPRRNTAPADGGGNQGSAQSSRASAADSESISVHSNSSGARLRRLMGMLQRPAAPPRWSSVDLHEVVSIGFGLAARGWTLCDDVPPWHCISLATTARSLDFVCAADDEAEAIVLTLSRLCTQVLGHPLPGGLHSHARFLAARGWCKVWWAARGRRDQGEPPGLARRLREALEGPRGDAGEPPRSGSGSLASDGAAAAAARSGPGRGSLLVEAGDFPAPVEREAGDACDASSPRSILRRSPRAEDSDQLSAHDILRGSPRHVTIADEEADGARSPASSARSPTSSSGRRKCRSSQRRSRKGLRLPEAAEAKPSR